MGSGRVGVRHCPFWTSCTVSADPTVCLRPSSTSHARRVVFVHSCCITSNTNAHSAARELLDINRMQLVQNHSSLAIGSYSHPSKCSCTKSVWSVKITAREFTRALDTIQRTTLVVVGTSGLSGLQSVLQFKGNSSVSYSSAVKSISKLWDCPSYVLFCQPDQVNLSCIAMEDLRS